MKQSVRTQLHSDVWSEKEIEVCGILLDLHNLLLKSKRACRSSLPYWGAKRSRSASDSIPTSVDRQKQGGAEEREERGKVEPDNSPSTPLSFSPSEPDCKSKHQSKTNSKKKTRDELLEAYGGLVKSREVLRLEVQNARRQYERLHAYNLSLKARKQKIITEKCQLGMNGRVDLETKLNPRREITAAAPQQTVQDQPQVGGIFGEPFGQDAQSPCPGGGGLGSPNHAGRRGIPDLNATEEETVGVAYHQPLELQRVVLMDNSRYRAALARRRRMGKLREIRSSLAAPRVSRVR